MARNEHHCVHKRRTSLHSILNHAAHAKILYKHTQSYLVTLKSIICPTSHLSLIKYREKISNDLDHRFSNMSNLNQNYYLSFTQEDLNKKDRSWGESWSSIDFQLTEMNSGISLRIISSLIQESVGNHTHHVAYQSHQGAALDFISHLWVPSHFSGA